MVLGLYPPAGYILRLSWVLQSEPPPVIFVGL
jgi:hypothetical protein